MREKKADGSSNLGAEVPKIISLKPTRRAFPGRRARPHGDVWFPSSASRPPPSCPHCPASCLLPVCHMPPTGHCLAWALQVGAAPPPPDSAPGLEQSPAQPVTAELEPRAPWRPAPGTPASPLPPSGCRPGATHSAALRSCLVTRQINPSTSAWPGAAPCCPWPSQSLHFATYKVVTPMPRVTVGFS